MFSLKTHNVFQKKQDVCPLMSLFTCHTPKVMNRFIFLQVTYQKCKIAFSVGDATVKLTECPKWKVVILWGTWMSSLNVMPIWSLDFNISCVQVAILAWWSGGQGVTKIIRNHPLGTVNIQSEFNGNLFFQDILLWTRAWQTDQTTDSDICRPVC